MRSGGCLRGHRATALQSGLAEGAPAARIRPPSAWGECCVWRWLPWTPTGDARLSLATWSTGKRPWPLQQWRASSRPARSSTEPMPRQSWPGRASHQRRRHPPRWWPPRTRTLSSERPRPRRRGAGAGRRSDGSARSGRRPRRRLASGRRSWPQCSWLCWRWPWLRRGRSCKALLQRFWGDSRRLAGKHCAAGAAMVTQRCSVLCCAVLCFAVLCCAVLCCDVPCCAVLCCALPAG
mmetsp:Transcript_11298/g.43615  ORF Transcript_11298/g.43615 Transcript_11298/m.43615 type:complete len:236 (+) Transcript_11298:1011-1718(+)